VNQILALNVKTKIVRILPKLFLQKLDKRCLFHCGRCWFLIKGMAKPLVSRTINVDAEGSHGAAEGENDEEPARGRVAADQVARPVLHAHVQSRFREKRFIRVFKSTTKSKEKVTFHS